MGTDDAFLPLFEADAGDDAAAHAGFAVEAEIMLVEIDGGGLFRYQDFLVQPLGESSPGAGVFVIGGRIAGGCFGIFQADEIIGTAGMQIIM